MAGASKPTGEPSPGRAIRWLAIATVCVVALFSGLIGAVIGSRLADDDPSRSAAPSPATVVRPAAEVDGEPLDVGSIVAKVQPSVVNITARSGGGIGVGTGVVLSADGEVVTNAHVVGSADEVNVLLVGEVEPRSATVVASDESNDLALIRINDVTGLTPIDIAGVDELQIGDDVVAIGYALDLDGGPSVTKGIVSGLERTLDVGDTILDGLVQTDAAISSGNSGGPLVNSRGQLVGINTAVASGGPDFAANNIGFAIGLPEALPILDAMRAGTGNSASGFLGVQIQDRIDGGSGALITEVVEGSPAEAAGMQVGDVVVGANGGVVNGAGGLIAAIRDLPPGGLLRLDVERNGSRITLDATLVERDD